MLPYDLQTHDAQRKQHTQRDPWRPVPFIYLFIFLAVLGLCCIMLTSLVAESGFSCPVACGVLVP